MRRAFPLQAKGLRRPVTRVIADYGVKSMTVDCEGGSASEENDGLSVRCMVHINAHIAVGCLAYAHSD